MEENIPDFVIKRKRKRWKPAMDPGIGCYMRSTPPLAQNISIRAVTHLDSSPDAPNIALLTPSFQTRCLPISSQDTPLNQNSVVSVDEFLRRSTKMPTRMYAGTKKRLCAGARVSEKSVKCYRNKFSPRKKTISSRFRSGVQHAYRLLRAAVTSTVQPGPFFETSEPSFLSRPPLQFVAGARVSQLQISLNPALTLVSPQETEPLQDATFWSNHLVTIGSTNRRQGDTQNIRASDTSRLVSDRKTKVRPTRAKEIQLRPSDCLPLSFVPFQVAEAKYRARLTSTECLRFSNANGDDSNLQLHQDGSPSTLLQQPVGSPPLISVSSGNRETQIIKNTTANSSPARPRRGNDQSLPIPWTAGWFDVMLNKDITSPSKLFKLGQPRNLSSPHLIRDPEDWSAT